MTPLKFIRNYGLWAWLRHGITWPKITIIIEFEASLEVNEEGELEKIK